MRLCLAPLLLATTAAAQPACQPSEVESQAALNRLRAEAHRCGDRLWPAASTLRVSAVLTGAAARHAQELAGSDRVAHEEPAGLALRARLREAGYVHVRAGENLAGGQATLDEVLAQWLASPAHCRNLMGAGFEEFGLACAEGPGQLRHYWVLQLAAPLRSSPGRSP